MKTNPNDPIAGGNFAYYNEKGEVEREFRPSLTKREHFAAMAMQGLIASWGQHDLNDTEEIAHDAVGFADALIAALNESSTEN